MSDANTTTSGVASPANSLVAVAAAASALWVVVEVALRRELAAPIGDLLGSAAGGYVAALALATVGGAAIAAAIGYRGGVTVADWDLALSRRGVFEGVGAVVAYYAFLFAAAVVATVAFGLDPNAATTGGGFDGPRWTLVALFVANGVLGPIAEEVAWRGVVQTAFTAAVGVAAGSPSPRSRSSGSTSSSTSPPHRSASRASSSSRSRSACSGIETGRGARWSRTSSRTPPRPRC